MVLANLVVLLLLGAVLAGRLTRVWVERRRGSAGVAAACPAGAAVQRRRRHADHRGGGVRHLLLPSRHPGLVQRPVRTALEESLQAARGYLEEHRNNIRADALGMANDLVRAGQLPRPRPERLRPGAGRADRAARPDRGGDLRAGDRAGHGLGRVAADRSAAALGDRAGARRRRGGARQRRFHPRARGGAAGTDAAADAADRPPGRSADPRPHAPHRGRRWPNTSGWTRTAPGCR